MIHLGGSLPIVIFLVMIRKQMQSMTGSVEFSEIYLCDFPFTSGLESKKRPALIIFDLSDDVLISRITSVPKTTTFDLPVRDWQAAGLLKPSTIR
jgi:mRNA interferase MazF